MRDGQVALAGHPGGTSCHHMRLHDMAHRVVVVELGVTKGDRVHERHRGHLDRDPDSESGSRCHESSQSHVNRGSCEGCGNVHRGISRQVSREILPLRDDPCRTFFCRAARWGDEVGWPYNKFVFVLLEGLLLSWSFQRMLV